MHLLKAFVSENRLTVSCKPKCTLSMLVKTIDPFR